MLRDAPRRPPEAVDKEITFRGSDVELCRLNIEQGLVVVALVGLNYAEGNKE